MTGTNQRPTRPDTNTAADAALLAADNGHQAGARLWHLGLRLLATQPLDYEEQQRRLLFGCCALTCGSMMLIFGVYHLLFGPAQEGVANLFAASASIVMIASVRRKANGQAVYLWFTGVGTALVMFFGTLGDTDGSRLMWAYLVPPFTLMVAGPRWGLACSAAVFVAWELFLLLPPDLTGAAFYSDGFQPRFTASYLLVVLFSYFAVRVQQHYSLLVAAHARCLEQEKRALAEAEAQMRELALRDSLTGVANRRAISDRLDAAVAQANRDHTALSVALLDIDHFKNVNDTYGHPAGDAVLTTIAQRMRTTLRDADAESVGRFGGEEFLLILPGVSGDGLHRVLNRLRETLSGAPVQHDQMLIAVTASIGAATADASINSADALIRAADSALYKAKTQGRNRVVAPAASRSDDMVVVG